MSQPRDAFTDTSTLTVRGRVSGSSALAKARAVAKGPEAFGHLTLDGKEGHAEWLEHGTVDLGVLTASSA